MSDLLPPNSTATERAISRSLARIGEIPAPAGQMWDPDRIPAAWLPWLAWAASVDDWNPDWPEAARRAAVAGSADWHRRKGTLASVLAVLAQAGHPAATVTEDRDLPRLGDDDLTLGAGWVLGPDDPSWADYWVTLAAPALRPEALRIMARLRDTAPARCRLRAVALAPAQLPLGHSALVLGPDIAIGNIYFEE